MKPYRPTPAQAATLLTLALLAELFAQADSRRQGDAEYLQGVMPQLRAEAGR